MKNVQNQIISANTLIIKKSRKNLRKVLLSKKIAYLIGLNLNP